MTTQVPVFPVPALADLQTQILADLASVPGLDQTLGVGVTPVLALLLAKLAAGEYAYLAQLPNRALIPTLMAFPYLDVYCQPFGLTREPATAASGNVILTGAPGIPIPAGVQMQDSTGTVTLQTMAAAQIAPGAQSVAVPVQSITTGMAANLLPNAPVTLLTAIAGILATGAVDGNGLSGGADQESDAALQARLAERLGSPPQGGAVMDFVAWAKQVGGVTRVWVYPTQNGPGTATLAFMMDGRANPVPLAADVANVQAAINAAAPVVGDYIVLSIQAQAVPVAVHGLTAANGYTLAQVQAGVSAAIAALNYLTTPGGYGWDGQAQNFLSGGTLYLEQIYAAIANTPGVAAFDLAAPAADITVNYGYIVQLGAPSFA